MTKAEFVRAAIPQPIALGGMPLSADPRLFPAGSCGWRWNGSLYVKVGGDWLSVLAAVQMTVIGSRKWEADIAAIRTTA
jgi:hypothetical protein